MGGCKGCNNEETIHLTKDDLKDRQRIPAPSEPVSRRDFLLAAALRGWLSNDAAGRVDAMFIGDHAAQVAVSAVNKIMELEGE